MNIFSVFFGDIQIVCSGNKAEMDFSRDVFIVWVDSDIVFSCLISNLYCVYKDGVKIYG